MISLSERVKKMQTQTSPENPPSRIASLAPDVTEILFALGLDDKIVAVSSDSDFPPQAKDKIQLGSFWQPDVESVIASRPDLVVNLWFEQQKVMANRLEELGYNTLTLTITTMSELYEAVEQIGAATSIS